MNIVASLGACPKQGARTQEKGPFFLLKGELLINIVSDIAEGLSIWIYPCQWKDSKASARFQGRHDVCTLGKLYLLSYSACDTSAGCSAHYCLFE